MGIRFSAITVSYIFFSDMSFTCFSARMIFADHGAFTDYAVILEEVF